MESTLLLIQNFFQKYVRTNVCVIVSVTINDSEVWFVNVQDIKVKAIIKACIIKACNYVPLMCGGLGLETFDNEFILSVLFQTV